MASITVDPITYKKLILVKQLYQQAITQSISIHSIVSRILAVVEFDLAMETALKAVYSSLESSKTPPTDFQPLVQQCDSLLASKNLSPIPDRANVQYVHMMRNDAQHKARYPNESDVNDCRTYARDFLRKLIDSVWGLKFDSISLTEIIQHKEVKDHLVNAEDALVKGNWDKAVIQASKGLRLALEIVIESFFSYRHINERYLIYNQKDEIDVDTKILDAVDEIQYSLIYNLLRMNYSDFSRCMRIARIPKYVSLTRFFKDPRIEEKVGASEAEFVVGYCIDTVAQVESLVRSLDKPFGGERALFSL